MEDSKQAEAAGLFPLFVDLSAKCAVVIGAGNIATRRAKALAPFVGSLRVYAPDVSPDMERLAENPRVSLERKRFDPAQLNGADLVLACTDSPEINNAIWEECKKLDVLVNVCSDRSKCDFHFPGLVVCDDAVVGVNAGGRDHKRAREVREAIEQLLNSTDV